MKNKIIGLVILQLLILTSCKEEDLGANPQKITTVAGKTGDVVLTPTDILGLGSAASLNAGSAANNLVQLDGTGKVPTAVLPIGVGSVTMSGDISSSSDTSLISKLKGVIVTISSLTTNDVLQYNGSNWVNSQISFQQYAGEIIDFAGTTCPTGTLLADGSVYARAVEPNLFAAISCAHGCPTGSTFSVPDLRGKFIRYIDGATGQDPNAATRTAAATGGNTGSNVGSVQSDAYASHNHQTITGIDAGNGAFNGQGGTSTLGTWSTGGAGNLTINQVGLTVNTLLVSSSGGSETRPKNVYMTPCIRRYNR